MIRYSLKFHYLPSVYCYQTADCGGWNIFQRRTDGSVDSFGDWEHFKQNFSSLQNDHWLGNKNIYILTFQDLCTGENELRIYKINSKKIKKSLRYANFYITNTVSKNTFHVNSLTGTLADAFKQHKRSKFFTFDLGKDTQFRIKKQCF